MHVSHKSLICDTTHSWVIDLWHNSLMSHTSLGRNSLIIDTTHCRNSLIIDTTHCRNSLIFDTTHCRNSLIIDTTLCRNSLICHTITQSRMSEPGLIHCITWYHMTWHDMASHHMTWQIHDMTDSWHHMTWHDIFIAWHHNRKQVQQEGSQHTLNPKP